MKIITHSGAAHRDEILAIAVISFKEKIPPSSLNIVRQPECDVSTTDADFVVDIGRVYDPSRKLFDHHQLPADAPPTCALTLVSDYYGLVPSKFPWMERVAILDSKGIFWWFRNKFGRAPKNTAEVGVALDDRASIFSYIERVANKRDFYEALDIAYGWMTDEISHVESYSINIEEARKLVQIIELGNGFKMAYFDTEKLPPCAMSLVDSLAGSDPTIIISGKRDERADGFSATRLMDNPLVDFAKRIGESDCVFAHNNGFCLKWKKDWLGFIQAICRSISV